MRSVGDHGSPITHLQVILANEVAHVINVHWKGTAGLIRFVSIWHGSVAAKDEGLCGRQVCGIVLPRYAKVNDVVLRMRRSCMMFGGVREVTISSYDASMIEFRVKRFRAHHDTPVHGVPMIRYSAVTATTVVIVHEMQALQRGYSVSPPSPNLDRNDIPRIPG